MLSSPPLTPRPRAAGAGSYGAGGGSFFQDVHDFLQVEVAAPSDEGLAAWEARVRSQLAHLARYTARPAGSVRAEALLHAFRQPVEQDAAGEGSSRDGGGSGEVHRSLFFLGVAEKEVGTSWQLACLVCPCRPVVPHTTQMAGMPCQWPVGKHMATAVS